MLYISPSRIARYFYHECERYLVYSATPKQMRKSLGIPSPPWEYSPVTKAILDGGHRWEEEVVTSRMQSRIHMAGNSSLPLKDRIFNEADTINTLTNLREDEYIYQACLMTPDSFYKEYNLDRNHIAVARCFPDLIYGDKPGNDLRLRVIDVKASEEMKTSHKVQVTLYSLILSHILREKSLTPEMDMAEGGVWVYGKDEPEWFDMHIIRPQVEAMLSVDLPRIAVMEPAKVLWHLHYRCEWCEYYPICREEAEKSKSISLIPYLTTQGKKYLSSDASVNTLHDMKDFLQKPDAGDILSRCSSLSKKENRFAKMVESILQGQIYSFGSSSVSMPIGENIKLLLTLQREPVSGKIYTCGLLRTGNVEIFGTKDNLEKQFVAHSPGDCDQVRREFIENIYEIFEAVHDYNNGKDWKDQKSLQTFVFDSYEWRLLKQLLLDGLKDRNISSKALALFFHFHSEDLFSAEDHPEVEASFPVVILTEVIYSLFALPVPLAYQLAPVLDVLVPAQAGKYKPGDYFTFALSNALRSDTIHSVWHEGKSERIDWIKKEIQKRLWATLSVIHGIRNTAKTTLFAWPPKFSLPAREDFNSVTLSRLGFITRYESILSFLEIRGGRVLARDEREKRNSAFRAEALQGGRFRIVSGNKEDFGTGEYLLSEDTDEGDKTQMSFPDFYYKDKMYMPNGKNLCSARVDRIEEIGGDYFITPSLKGPKSFPGIIDGKFYLLQQRFMDWNSGRVFKRLKEIDEEGRTDILNLLEEPVDYCEDVIVEKKFRKEILKQIARFSFTKSQKDAFLHLLEKNLTLVWGPPGTGKTHFIALSLLCFMEVCRRENKHFRVYLSAYTHTAIENCMKKLIQINKKDNIWQEFNMVKLDGGKSAEITYESTKECISYLDDHDRCIVGGTVYSLLKVFKKDSSRPFDLVVLDEGSQVRVPEALIPLSRVKEGGRILIAGDDKQLPPIINGLYPEPEGQEPLLHLSVFQCLREPDRGKNEITCQLLENFRMNETLCSYPADKIYGKDYKGFDTQIAQRRLFITGPAGSDRIVEEIIDPDYPIVVCVMEGVRAGAVNIVEADLVADITCALRQRLCRDNIPYPDTEEGDKLFWKEGLFIVSPHHVQIKAIKKALAGKGLREPFFVDTVEKMQGQECDAVIVSYGVSDPELAMQEGEFIYSLNRLNVAITRAKSKSIVFLSRHLLTPTFHVLENQEAGEGISFMLGLEEFARNGVKTEHKLNKGAGLIIYRR